MRTIVMFDPVANKSYKYTLKTENEQRLYDALKGALRDECPPDKEHYLCKMGEDDDIRCEECWLRYATIDLQK